MEAIGIQSEVRYDLFRRLLAAANSRYCFENNSAVHDRIVADCLELVDVAVKRLKKDGILL